MLVILRVLTRIIMQVLTTLAIAITMLTIMPPNMNWYQYMSVGAVSAMLSEIYIQFMIKQKRGVE